MPALPAPPPPPPTPDGHTQDFARAREHFLEAAARGMPAALNGLGVLYFHGQGVPANMSEVGPWLRFWFFLEGGHGCDRPRHALRPTTRLLAPWMVLPAGRTRQLGNPPAPPSAPPPPPMPQAFRYFAAAAGEDHDAAYNLGTMHQGGHSVPRNMSAALELFHAAVGLGSWRAAHQLFLVHADGLHGAPKRPDRALRSFWRFMAMTGGWKEAGQEAADRAAGEDGRRGGGGGRAGAGSDLLRARASVGRAHERRRPRSPPGPFACALLTPPPPP
jgi:hypothetical protein